MALGDTLRRIVASDNFILNAAGALVGIKNPNANGLDLRVDQPAAYLPYILAQSATPSIYAPSGTSNASGLITLGTALPYQPTGVVQIYLPAGVVVGDAVGGLKAIVFSSTAVGQLVGSPVTANGAYTALLATYAQLASVVVPGGAMGANGSLRVSVVYSVVSSANFKTSIIRMGGVQIGTVGTTNASSLGYQVLLFNRGSQALNLVQAINTPTPFSGTIASPNTQASIDTSVPQTLSIGGQIQTSTAELLMLEGYTVEVLPAA